MKKFTVITSILMLQWDQRWPLGLGDGVSHQEILLSQFSEMPKKKAEEIPPSRYQETSLQIGSICITDFI